MGEDGFYEAIFSDLKIPYMPVRWQTDQPDYAAAGIAQAQHRRRRKKPPSFSIINAYRIRGHLLANTNPLGSDPAYHPDLDPAIYGLSIWDLDRPFLAGAVKAPSGAIASYMQPYETLARNSRAAADNILRHSSASSICISRIRSRSNGCRTAWKAP